MCTLPNQTYRIVDVYMGDVKMYVTRYRKENGWPDGGSQWQDIQRKK